jgi:hypothetical protein
MDIHFNSRFNKKDRQVQLKIMYFDESFTHIRHKYRND